VANALYYGDNLGYLREMDRESVDLIYLDPPFNSQSTYNLLFKSPKGGAVEAQTTAFKDTWAWDLSAERAFDEAISSGSPAVSVLRALRVFLGQSDLMAYLAMMAPRLIAMRRVLKPTGALYLHCDPAASHYLKIVLDGIFSDGSFRNEIIWQRSTGKSLMTRRLPNSHDVILAYQMSDKSTWNSEAVFKQYDLENLPIKTAGKYSHRDPDGRLYQLDNLINPNPNRPNLTYEFLGITKVWRWTKDRMQKACDEGLVVQPSPGSVPRFKRYLDEQRGVPLGDVWTDIPPINSQAQERLGYPTQKPLALLQRIILASSNKGDTVLDPFCGCGTTIEAAELTGRRWVGIDITHHAIDVIEGRLRRMPERGEYEVKGRPADVDSALRLAEQLPYEFQWWANWMLGVQNYREHKKGPDKGIDGIIYFHNPPHGVGQIVVSVKAGRHIGPDMISALEGTVKREDAQIGVFVCATTPTAGMRSNAAAMGFVRIGREQYPRIQIVTADELLNGPHPQMPRAIESEAFRQPLRPPTPTRVATPQPQLSFALPIPGMKGKRADVQDHLAGNLLAEVAASVR
jgi:DNA modification methylase